METVTLIIKNKKRKKFFFQLLEQLDFVEINQTKKSNQAKYDFFQTAGIWAERNIDAKKLRESAWNRVH